MRTLALALVGGMWLSAVELHAATPYVAPVTQDSTKAKKKGKKDDGDKNAVTTNTSNAPAAPNAAKVPRTPSEDSARLIKRTEHARGLPLFKSTTSLPFTLISDFGRIGKDRDSLSTKRYAGVLVVADDKGEERRIPVSP